ncbi:uncharacterized protein LOC116407911 isoform X2 [Xenopus tropicalis]|uniref:Uncharacterized protein LOC116407911 isoform X2 n=1 Tax=Xenopus tropicalis TaxID=8364 RepID=A0A8J1IW76_XENTR|nr:uncharacterized protein LOC116407911 isoform X2 [Xenopus tropicalis]
MIKNTEDLLKCMLGADDPWYQVKSFVTTAIKEKVLSNEKGRRDLLFSACWIAENYKTLKDQNKMLGEKLEDLKGHYNALKITASTASAMCVNYHKTVNENSALKVENEELLGRLRDAEGAIRCLGALLNQPQVDHSHCKSEIEHLKAQLRRKDAVVAAFNVPGNPITDILGWDINAAHSAFVTCKQRREEPVQAFSERLYTLYSCTVQKPAKADLKDNVFKSALLTQSLPEIYQLVGLTVGPANSYLEVIDCLKRAESVVKECQRDFKSNIPVVKVS